MKYLPMIAAFGMAMLIGGIGGFYMGSSATTAVKEAIVEVSEEHVDAAAETGSKWGSAIASAAVEEYNARKAGACED